MKKPGITAKDLRDLIRGIDAATALRLTHPDIFGEYTPYIEEAAKATTRITANLTDKQRDYIFGGDTT